ncbi:hypothetical protein GS421_17005 [Rhodococcus hoagii]|nr:hypothetical protein [Prescottella equi]
MQDHFMIGAVKALHGEEIGMGWIGSKTARSFAVAFVWPLPSRWPHRTASAAVVPGELVQVDWLATMVVRRASPSSRFHSPRRDRSDRSGQPLSVASTFGSRTGRTAISDWRSNARAPTDRSSPARSSAISVPTSNRPLRPHHPGPAG